MPRGDGVVQECGAGLVDVRRSPRLGLRRPAAATVRSGRRRAAGAHRAALGVTDAAVEDMAWIDNGPGWVGVDLGSAEAVVDVVPDIAAFTDLKVTVLGRWDAAPAAELGADVEVRAFYADGRDFGEDPVTGRANAGLAQWLIGTGALPSAYTSRQGSVIGREGRVRVEAEGDQVWVSGDAVTRIVGEVDSRTPPGGGTRPAVGHGHRGLGPGPRVGETPTAVPGTGGPVWTCGRRALALRRAEHAHPDDVVLPHVPEVEPLAADVHEAVAGVEGIGTGVLLADAQPGRARPVRAAASVASIRRPADTRAVVVGVDVEAPELVVGRSVTASETSASVGSPGSSIV